MSSLTADFERASTALEDMDCIHCGLPVPAALVEPGAAEQFCCQGCRTVYAVLHDRGLEDYYAIRERLADESRPAKTTDRSYSELDHESFQELYAKTLPDGLRQVELYLEGVHCAACVWLVEKVTLNVPGTIESRLDIGSSTVRIVWKPEETTLSEIARFIDHLGYPVHPVLGGTARELRKREDRALLVRIGVAGAVAGNVMLMAFALYSGMFGDMTEEWVQFFRWGSLMVALPAVLYSGNIFYRGAWAALRTRTPHMDLPITIGILAGFSWGIVSTIRGTGEIYFDSITALIFLLLIGRWLQRRQQRGAAEAAELLYALAPSTARVLTGDSVTEIPIAAIEEGVLLEVRAGDTVPADGLVESGCSSVDTSVLTGESRPVDVAEGDLVHAGTVNVSSRLVVRAQATGEASRVGRLMKMVEEAARRRAPVVQLADAISAYFVVAVLGLATLTFVVWMFLDPSVAVDRAVALLIITCPCALGLATPLAVSAAVGKAARAGILIKGADVIERLAKPGRIFFDKTGTLTEGRMTVVDFEGDRSVIPWLVSLEKHSSHPIASAILRWTGSTEVQELEDVEQTLGGGLVARLPDGRPLAAGSISFVRDLAESPDWLTRRSEEWTRDAKTPVAVALGGRIIALLGIADTLRSDAEASVRRIRSMGYASEVLSGDHPLAAQAIGRALGLEARGAASPEDKLRTVESAAEREPVIMVGDGVNDAAALSAAGVGVAVHGGAEASLAAADVFMTQDGVEGVVRLIDGARRTMKVIRRNLVFSLGYNVLGVALAVTGIIGPLGAAVLMPLSSLTVVTSSFRSRTFEER